MSYKHNLYAAMILEGFQLGSDFISLNLGGQNLDLHNNYNFTRFCYSITERTLDLYWVLGNREWIPQDLPQKLQLSFSGVYLFKAQERDSKMPFTEDDCLDSIGFIWNSMIDTLDGFAKHEPEEDCNHLNLNFRSGFAVRIGADKGTLIAAYN